MANENGWGGKRENQTGRPKQEVVRKMRSTRAFDDEWELAKSFLDLMKNGHMEECKAFISGKFTKAENQKRKLPIPSHHARRKGVNEEGSLAPRPQPYYNM